jgi:bile acid:Na+ symporter, BASS family
LTLLSVVLVLLKVSIVLSVFALGLNATVSDTTYLFRHPGELIRAVFSMYVLMPLLAIALLMTLHLHPAVKLTLITLAVSPVPPIVPARALKGDDQDDYTVGLLVAASVLALALIPVAITYFEHSSKVPMEMSARSMAALIIATIWIPLLAGTALHDAAPEFAEQMFEPVSHWATLLLILSALSVLIGSMPAILSLLGDGTLLSLVVFALAGYFIGDFFGRPDFETRRVLGLATATRHPAIAAVIAATAFPRQTLAVPAIVLYLIIAGSVTGLAAKLNPRPTRLVSAKTERGIAA